MGSLLLPYQSEWISRRDNVVFWEKSRRIGASFCDAADSVLTASAMKGPMNVLYIGYNKDMATEYIHDCGTWAKAFNRPARYMGEDIWKDGKEEILTYVIRFASGKAIKALPSKPKSLRSRQGKVVLDEAAYIEDLPGMIKAAMALLMWGGRIRVLSTHNGQDNEFYKLISEIKDGKWPYTLQSTKFMQAVREGLFKKICEVTGQEWSEESERQWIDEMYLSYGDSASEELDCIARSSGYMVIPRAMLERCANAEIPVLRLERHEEFYMDDDRLADIRGWISDHLNPVLESMSLNSRTVLGMDFGRDIDLSVIWVLQNVSDTRWRTAFIVELRCIPFDCQKLILFQILNEVPLLMTANLEGRGNGQQLSEEGQQEFGPNRVNAVSATTGFYGMEVPAYKAALEGKEIIIPKDESVFMDHRSFIRTRGGYAVDSRTSKGSDGKKRHGDSAVAGLLAWAAARLDCAPAMGVVIEPRAANRPSNRAGMWR